MLKLTRDELYDVLRFTISYTTDERVMLRAWRLLRSRTKAPLFPVELSYSHRLNDQTLVNRITIEAMMDHGLAVRDIARLTGLHRTSVHRHLRAYRSLSPVERRQHQAMTARLRQDIEDHFEDRYSELVVERSRPRL